MASYQFGDMLGGWQDDVANLISLDTMTKKLPGGKIELMGKKYDEAKGYGYTGNTIDPYVAKNAGVSAAVAKSFRLNIEPIRAGELEKKRAKIALDIEKEKKKGKSVLKWYHYALIGGGMLTLIALSPTLSSISRAIPSAKT
jgi:hypothetical protein